jgi:hypothetical protein
MKTILLLLVLLLASCSESQVDQGGKIQVDGLEGCVVKRFVPCKNCDSVLVVRCPNSSTTTKNERLEYIGSYPVTQVTYAIVVEF